MDKPKLSQSNEFDLKKLEKDNGDKETKELLLFDRICLEITNSEENYCTQNIFLCYTLNGK